MTHDVLQTPRLTLRPLQPSDWEAVHAYAADPEVTRYMLWGPNEPEQTRAYLRMVSESQGQNGDEYAYGILLQDTGGLIGSCSLRLAEAPAGTAGAGSIGYILHRDFWGRGLATECAYALLVLGFDELGLSRITATCRPENRASQRVLEKIGMVLEERLVDHVVVRGEPRDSLRFGLQAERWRSGHRRAVIFDMDGVVIDSEPVYFAANQRIFGELGFTITQDDYAQFVGLDAARMWSALKERHALPHDVETLIGLEAAGMVAGLEAADLTAMPGLHPLLDRLRTDGFKLALASSSMHQVIRTVLKKLGLEHVFDPVVSGEDVAHGKPAPDIFLHAAGLLGVPPAGCLVIEDSANGVRAAKAAGMRCIGLRNPNSGTQDLSPADRIIDSLENLDLQIEITVNGRITRNVSTQDPPAPDAHPR